MGLPKIDLPIFELELPSNGKKVKYRQYTVKEEKILLVAQEADDRLQELLATKQIVNNCLVDATVSEISMFDLEYLLLALRSKSVDNVAKIQIIDEDTQEPVNLELDLTEVEVTRNEAHTNKVQINEDYTLFLRYPTIDEFIRIAETDENDPLVSYLIMVSCLDKVASEDEVHEFKNYTTKEVDDFMESVTTQVVEGIRQFFETMPKIRQVKTYKNKNGDLRTFVIEGQRSFFI